jgi:hypothetical protein
MMYYFNSTTANFACPMKIYADFIHCVRVIPLPCISPQCPPQTTSKITADK